MLLAPGTLVDGYRINAEIGRGGMAVVYRAQQVNLQRDVALKVMLELPSDQAAVRARFRQEALAVARLRHPAILVIHDVGEYLGNPYLVTELVEGGTLATLQGRPQPLDRVVLLLRPVAEALDYAHLQGILHRDVKPSNVLLRRDGSPVLADFGLARALEGDAGLTRSGLMLGTPAYMAPEQAMGSSAELTGAVDRYALAVVAYELLTGAPPFSGPTPLAVVLAQVQQQPPAPQLRNPAIGAGVGAILLQGLAKAPAQRPGSAAEFIDALADGRSQTAARETATVFASTVDRASVMPTTLLERGHAFQPFITASGTSMASTSVSQSGQPARREGGLVARILGMAAMLVVVAVAVVVLLRPALQHPGASGTPSRAFSIPTEAIVLSVTPTVSLSTPAFKTVLALAPPTPTSVPALLSFSRRLLAAIPVGAITTFAGGLGGGSKRAAPLGMGIEPTGVAIAGAHELLIADTSASVIWLVNRSDRTMRRFGRRIAAGQMGIVAGNGAVGSGGDGGPATQASLTSPNGLALDNAGNLFIADSGSDRVREVDAASGIITTVAGNGKQGYSGDGRLATQAEFSGPDGLEPGVPQLAPFPWGLAVDSLHNVYVADMNNNRVREVHAGSGIITTVAGTGKQGYGGDGELATEAELDQPAGLAVDSDGNLFISDSGNERVREVHAGSGIITTVVGKGSRVYGGDGGPVTQAGLYSAGDLAVDSTGNLYISDLRDNVVLEAHAGSGIITTVAGNSKQGYLGDGGSAPKAELNSPWGLAVDQAGNLYIADSGNYEVREVYTGSGTIATVVGQTAPSGDGGPATEADLGEPIGLTVDQPGNLYILNRGADVREVKAASGIISSVAGLDQLGGLPQLGETADRAGNLYFADLVFSVVRELHADSSIVTTVAGRPPGNDGMSQSGFSGDGGPATQAKLFQPTGLVVDDTGNIFIADTGNNVVREVHAVTGIITTVAGTGKSGYTGNGGLATEAELDQPNGLALDRAGNLYIADCGNDVVREVHAVSGTITTVAGNGQFGSAGDGGSAIQAELAGPGGVDQPQYQVYPWGIAVDQAGNLYIADWGNRVREVHVGSGIITTVAGNGKQGAGGDGGLATQAELDQPTALAFDKAGNLYIADCSNRVRKVNADNSNITTVAGSGQLGFAGDGGLATQASLHAPQALAFDVAGDLYIADSNNNLVRLVNAGSGTITTMAGTQAEFFKPTGLALDQAGNLYILEFKNSVLYERHADTGTITTAFEVAQPGGLAFDQAGDLFVAEMYNGLVVERHAGSSKNTTVAGSSKQGYGGDGGPATKAELDEPSGLAIDQAGNLYIADDSDISQDGGNRVREVHAGTGIITTVAGTGKQGFSGDGGPATQAELNWPQALAFDQAGNLYIADFGNNRVREVHVGTGIITTVAGNGKHGFSGDGGPAILAKLSAPTGLAFDNNGNLYIADSGNNRVRVIHASSQ